MTDTPASPIAADRIDWDMISGELLKSFQWVSGRAQMKDVGNEHRREYARISAEIATALARVSAEARDDMAARRGTQVNLRLKG